MKLAVFGLQPVDFGLCYIEVKCLFKRGLGKKQIRNPQSKICNLKRLSPRKTCFKVVPPEDFVAFVELPAEQGEFAVTQKREVN